MLLVGQVVQMKHQRLAGAAAHENCGDFVLGHE
jgi:hypothetical protein